MVAAFSRVPRCIAPSRLLARSWTRSDVAFAIHSAGNSHRPLLCLAALARTRRPHRPRRGIGSPADDRGVGAGELIAEGKLSRGARGETQTRLFPRSAVHFQR